MWNKCLFAVFMGTAFLFLSSCKNEFEEIRKSDDVEAKFAKAMEYYDAEDWYKSQYLISAVMPYMKAHKEIDKLYFRFAYTHYHMNQYTSSSYYFKDFAQKFSESEFAEDAMFMSAYSTYKMAPSFRLDQTATEEAINGFQYFINFYPQSTKISQCNKLMDELRLRMEKKAFTEAKLYFDLRNYQSATKSFENILKDYPDSPQAEQIRFLIVKSGYRLAMNSVDSKKMARFTETVQKYKEFETRYPNSEYKKEALSLFNNSKEEMARLKGEK